MTEQPARGRETEPANPVDAAVVDFLRALSKIVRLFNLYPTDHSFVKEGVEDALRMYHALSAVAPGLTIAHSEGRLLVEERQISGLPTPVNDVIGMFRQKNIDSIQLSGMADDSEILSFAQLLGLRKGAEPHADMKIRSFAELKSIKINEVTYRKVSASQAVVDKAQAAKAGQDARPALDPAAVELLLSSQGGGAEISKTISADPVGFGRAIHSVSSQHASPEEWATGMIESAATGILESGGGYSEVAGKISAILGGLPSEFVRGMTGGAAPSDAPHEVVRRFSSALKGRLIAGFETRGAGLATVAGLLTKLGDERHARADLLEATSSALAASGNAFIDAAPYVLDLVEIDRRARKAETEGLDTTVKAAPKPVHKDHFSVLVVVDSPVYQQFFGSILDQTRFQASYSKDGKEAFETILRDKPDLVILDLKVQGMHGLEMIRQMRLRSVTPPLLIITEHSNLSQDFEVKTYPNQICLKKPPSKDAAGKAIEQLIGKPETGPQDEDETAKPRGIPQPYVAYLETMTRRDFPQVQGYEIAWEVDLGSGADAAAVSRFALPPGRTGILVITRSGIEQADIQLVGLFQTAVRVVSPFQTGGKPSIVQAAGLLGADRINETSLACQAVILEPGNGEIRICTAGAPAPLRFNESTRKIRKVGSVGVTVGGLLRGGLGRVLEEEKALLEPGDLLVLSTWGVQRSVNSRGEQFGVESIGGLLLTAQEKSPEAICKRILQGVKKHAGEDKFTSGAIVAIRKL